MKLNPSADRRGFRARMRTPISSEAFLTERRTMFDALNGVDWDLLHRQKLTLVEWLSGQPPKPPQLEEMWGVVHLLDSLQDDAVAYGRWQFPGDRGRKEGA
jgi:hypothetical protein